MQFNKSILAQIVHSCIHNFAAMTVVLAANSKLLPLQSMTTLTHSHYQRNTKSSAKHDRDCSRRSGLLGTDQFLTCFKSLLQEVHQLVGFYAPWKSCLSRWLGYLVYVRTRGPSSNPEPRRTLARADSANYMSIGVVND